MLTNFASRGIIAKRLGNSLSENGRVVELVDSLDSGSSVHYGRAGSSPASPTKKTQGIKRYPVFFLLMRKGLEPI